MKLCRIGWHDWTDYAKLEERDKTNNLVCIDISQICSDCKKVRVITLRPGVSYPYYTHGYRLFPNYQLQAKL